MALEQRGADLGLQRFDPLGHVRLHGVEFVGGAGDATEARHGREGHEIAQFHGVALVSFWRWQRSLVFIFKNDSSVYAVCPDRGFGHVDINAIDGPAGYYASDPL